MKVQSVILAATLAALPCLPAALSGQEGAQPAPSPDPMAEGPVFDPALAPAVDALMAPIDGSEPSTEIQSLPQGFLGYQLGMAIDVVKALLEVDDFLEYSGDADISLLPSRKESLIEVYGASFIKRASFQFTEDRLYVMIFSIDQSRLDHYSLFKTLSARYGKPTSLSPSLISWEDGSVRLSLERPLSVKYLDLESWKALNEAAAADKGEYELEREEFLDSF